MIFKNSKFYDYAKWFITVALPALTALWLAISSIWGLPYAEPIGATLTAITAFLAALLGIGSIRYKRLLEEDGDVN